MTQRESGSCSLVTPSPHSSDQRGEDPHGTTAVLTDNLLSLTSIKPYAQTLRATIHLHRMKLFVVQVGAAFRALHEMTLAGGVLFGPRRCGAACLENLGLTLGEIFLF